MTFLERVAGEKRIEVERAKEKVSEEELERIVLDAPPQRGFRAALAGRRGVIAEIKRASPSGGLLRKDLDPAEFARVYETAGAAALSVLTDMPYFQGSLDDLEEARAACTLPALRKDFLLERYQLLEARARGADCVLLIAAMVGKDLAGLSSEARAVGLDVLVEVHAEDGFRSAIDAGADLVGVNNRDLKTLNVDLAQTEKLARLKPPGTVLVSESGVSSPEDARRMFDAGADAILVGTRLVTSESPARELARLVGAAG